MSSEVIPVPVSITRCRDYDPQRLLASLKECLHPLGGMEAFVSPGDCVLLKPNLVSPHTADAAACTHPEIVRAVATQVMEAGGRVYLGDSPAVGSMSRVLRKSGNMEVVRDLGVELVPFLTPVKVPVPGGGVFRSLFLAREALGFDLIINLPRFKTHGMMTLTLSVKNMFGTVVGAAKPAWHLKTRGPGRFADLLLDVWSVLQPGLNILDGITAMEGNGPGAGGAPFPLGLLLASSSALALDNAAGEIAGISLREHPILRRALDRGFESARPDSFRVIGVDMEEVKRPFLLPVSTANVDDKLPDWMNRHLRKSLGIFPELKGKRCTSCGQCVSICPMNAIALFDGKRGGGIVDKRTCINCYCCQEVCPEGAIDLVPGRLLRILKVVNMA